MYTFNSLHKNDNVRSLTHSAQKAKYKNIKNTGVVTNNRIFIYELIFSNTVETPKRMLQISQTF